MKRALITWIRSKWSGNAKSHTDAELHGHDLALYRLKSKQDFENLTQTVERGWLSFMAFRDSLHDDRYWFSASEGYDGRVGRLMSAEVLIVSHNFFERYHQEFIEIVVHNLSYNRGPFLLDKVQQQQWQWILEKIESTLNCDYRFRREYLQELVLQAFHFALKQLIVVSYPNITIDVPNEQAAGGYETLFNHAAHISAN